MTFVKDVWRVIWSKSRRTAVFFVSPSLTDICDKEIRKVAEQNVKKYELPFRKGLGNGQLGMVGIEVEECSQLKMEIEKLQTS